MDDNIIHNLADNPGVVSNENKKTDNHYKDMFDAISIKLASPDKIKEWSYGEIKKSETINYRTFKPERGGLFCAKIFGPVSNYECLCGKYKRIKHKGIICEKCGVEVTTHKVRRERMGHIQLVSPIVHIWFSKLIPSAIGTLLGISSRELDNILYFENYIVLDPGNTDLEYNQIISDEVYYKTVETFGSNSFVALMGAEAIKELLKLIDVDYELELIDAQLSNKASEVKSKSIKLMKRKRLLKKIQKSGVRPDWMVLDVIPVLPPELRPLVHLDGGRFASSDLNDLYRRVINRNNRLKRLLDLEAPDIIIRNEKRMLQEAVDSLFDNTRRSTPVTDGNRRPLKSFADVLKGKQGRFRQNLLGKRVDYSGRSVITVGPNLKLNECGLPKMMAIELFRPFVYSRLCSKGIASSLKVARRMLEAGEKVVWDILEEVIKDHPILLNRAPTLHRLGIQAFDPKLVEGKAIHLHPLVCIGFNADFDGDQMAVHIPLSTTAQLEARLLMMPMYNILSPSNGKPIITPSQDIILGLYYLTLDKDLLLDNPEAKPAIIENFDALKTALFHKRISHSSLVMMRINGVDENGKTIVKRVTSLAGRFLLWERMPVHHNITFDLIDKVIHKSDIIDIIDSVYKYAGASATSSFLDDIMNLGFEMGLASGISISKNDIIIPKDKNSIIAKTKKVVDQYNNQYQQGLVTNQERYNKIIGLWSKCSDDVMKSMAVELEKRDSNNSLNSVYMMSDSGARGSVAQTRQLAGMRGLMAKSSGEIIETPILSNFKEGLSVSEYFISTHGARKGLADTALKTANAGYLTRRLVDVAQECVVNTEDCGSSDGILVKSILENGQITKTVGDNAAGRFLSQDAINHEGKVILEKNTYINDENAAILDKAGLHSVYVRSVLTCKCRLGICVKCYGKDLARDNIVILGQAVGVIAAQSIGEPGTQLTMRTFHIGGAAQGGIQKNTIEAGLDGVIKLLNASTVVDSNGNSIAMARNCEVVISDSYGYERFRQKIPYGSKVYVKDQEQVKFGAKIAEWDPFSIPVISDVSGIVKYADLVPGVSLSSKVDEDTGISLQVVTDYKQNAKSTKIIPAINITDKSGNIMNIKSGVAAAYRVIPNTLITVEENSEVKAGDVIARIPREAERTSDITGGLPKVVGLFEARKFKDEAILSDISGVIEYGKDYKTKSSVIVRSTENPEESYTYLIPKDKVLLAHEGDFVERGEQLTDGDINPHDILRMRGVSALADYMINEVQSVYGLQGVDINNKHIETIVRQMIKRVEVLDGGDSDYMIGDHIHRFDIDDINQKLIDDNKKPIQYIPLLQSITKASLGLDSFISAASFQETTKMLTNAALEGRVDKLEGLKENLIIGHLIPAGTGYIVNKKVKEQA